MAIDNLNYMSSGLPAGQQTDKYSSQPGCLKSKNLDIFSSSKSVKATAWSEATTTDNDIIKQDGKLVLKTDGKVYERTALGDTLVVDPAANFPVYQVSYNGKNGTYADAQRGTVQDLVAKYEGDELKSFVVFSDKASYNWSSVKYVPNKAFSYLDNLTYQGYPFGGKGYYFKQRSVGGTATLRIDIDSSFASIPLRIYAENYESDDTTIYLRKVTLYKFKYYYDAQLDSMMPRLQTTEELSFSGDITEGIRIDLPVMPRVTYTTVELTFGFTKKDGASTYGWQNGALYVDVNGGPEPNYYMTINGVKSDGDYNAYYTYLPVRERKLESIGDYGYSESYWMKGTVFQPLYKRNGSWIEVNGENKTIYDFISDMGWENDPSMDIIGLIVWNEQVYMIGNLEGNGYIIPCDLSGSRGTPFIAYGCTFKGVTNIDYLLYLVGEDRGISTLWVFNQQELVPVIGGNKENLDTDLVGVDEQYKFDGKIVNWRKNLILTTKDNRIFQYGQTYGGKGGSFVHQLPANAVITGLKANGNDLEINYSITVNDTTTNYTIKYQDDIAKKHYNTEWEAVYPIVLGNHLLEKEESDLFTSFILPAASTKLEFWGMANHYHFRTFTSEDNTTLSETENYKIKGTSGTYALKFIEKNANQYTFRLEGDLPVITTGEKQIIDSENTVVINYSDFNHFRRIGIIETDKYWEGDFRFHNLNNKLELPRSYSLQIMVKGKGTANYTPELFSVDLVANQRERG